MTTRTNESAKLLPLPDLLWDTSAWDVDPPTPTRPKYSRHGRHKGGDNAFDDPQAKKGGIVRVKDPQHQTIVQTESQAPHRMPCHRNTPKNQRQPKQPASLAPSPLQSSGGVKLSPEVIGHWRLEFSNSQSKQCGTGQNKASQRETRRRVAPTLERQKSALEVNTTEGTAHSHFVNKKKHRSKAGHLQSLQQQEPEQDTVKRRSKVQTKRRTKPLDRNKKPRHETFPSMTHRQLIEIPLRSRCLFPPGSNAINQRYDTYHSAHTTTCSQETYEVEELVTWPDMSAKDIFPFLRLPRELRDMIYEHVVPDLSGITRNFEKQEKAFIDGVSRVNQKQRRKMTNLFFNLSESNAPRECPAILQLNWQIYHEASRTFNRRVLVLKNATVNPPCVFPFSEMVGHGIVRKVRQVQFIMPIKYHTPETMLGEIRYGKNWYDHSLGEKGKISLDKPDFWRPMINDCLGVLWQPGHDVQKITISIKYRDSQRDYHFYPSQAMISEVGIKLSECSSSKDLEQWLHFLAYSEQAPPATIKSKVSALQDLRGLVL